MVIDLRDLAGGMGVRLLTAGWALIRTGEWRWPRLRRASWTIYRNDRAGAWVECGGRRTDLAPGQVYLIPARRPYRTHAEVAGILHFYLYLAVEGMPHDLVDGLPGVMRAPDLASGDWLAGLADRPGLTPSLADQARLLGLVLDTLIPHLPAREATVEPLRAAVEPALRLIDGAPRRAWRVPALAAACGCGEDAFLRRFRAAVGTTPVRYQRQVRANLAARLLVTTTLDLNAIARRCGLGERTNLSRVFKDVLGMSPLAYRTSTPPREESAAGWPPRAPV